MCTCIFLIRSPARGHVGHFHVLAVVCDAAVTGSADALRGTDCISPGEMPRSEAAGSYGSSIFNI